MRSLFSLKRIAALAALIHLAVANAAVAQGDGAGAPSAAQGEVAPAAPAAPAAPPPAAAPKTIADFGTVEQTAFAESTTVIGKVDADLNGVWLLVAHAQVAPGKFKSFPQMLRISAGANGPQLEMLDVRLPPEVVSEVQQASTRTFTRWVPSAQLRATLATSWAQLAPAVQKTLDEFLFSKIEFTLAAADSYGQVFPRRDEALEKVLEGSKWALKVDEHYQPRQLPDEARIAQLIQRTTIYAAKTVGKSEVRGALSLGFVAAGSGTPIPLQFIGDFTLYRLGSS